jgi:hypothetical protein|tara:strand:- start:349 stop:633 length:285 start_codon:yes stop_codon:yes gene_type:complete
MFVGGPGVVFVQLWRGIHVDGTFVPVFGTFFAMVDHGRIDSTQESISIEPPRIQQQRQPVSSSVAVLGIGGVFGHALRSLVSSRVFLSPVRPRV